MLQLEPLSANRSAAGASIPANTFIAQKGLPTHELAHLLDSLVRVSRRVKQKHFASNNVQGLAVPREESPPLLAKRAHTRTPDTCIKSQIIANTCIPIPTGKLPFMCKGNDLQK